MNVGKAALVSTVLRRVEDQDDDAFWVSAIPEHRSQGRDDQGNQHRAHLTLKLNALGISGLHAGIALGCTASHICLQVFSRWSPTMILCTRLQDGFADNAAVAARDPLRRFI